VLVATLLSIALPVVPTSSYAQAPAPNQVTSAETPQPASPAQLTLDNSHPGVYYIDNGGIEMSPSTYPVDGAIRFYGWSVLNPVDGTYKWAELDNYLAKRKSQGLETGVMITTYDGLTSGDIRSTPNFVIKKPNAVFPAELDGVANYARYWRKPAYNPGFEYNPSNYSWTLTGDASIQPEPEGKTGNAAKLGGVAGGSATLAHSAERIPAMPASLNGTKTVYITFDLYIETADTNPNDHLYVELWSNGAQLGTAQLDLTNLQHPSGSRQNYTFDVSAIAPEQNPQVTFRAVNDGANPTTFWVDNVELYVRHLIPNYESADYLNAYGNFITALGERYKSNLDMEFVAIGTGLFGENQPVQDNFNDFMKGKGLTSDDWVTYMKNVTAKYVSAFTMPGITGPSRSLLTQAAPSYLNISERKQITDYSAGFGVGISLNFLSPDWTQSYRGDLAGFYDPTRTYWRSVPIAYESYEMDLCNPVMVYYALGNALDKRVDYLRVDPALLRLDNGQKDTVNSDLYAWARQYVGGSAQSTPRAFVMMNEHRNPTLGNCRPGGLYYLDSKASVGSVWPHLGNFNFYLTQIDGIPGGRTVAETNDKGADSRYAKNPDNGTPWTDAGLGACPLGKSYRTDMYGTNYPCNYQPYNPNLPALGGQSLTDYRQFYNVDNWTGAGKEAYVVRRTDQNADPAKNNPYMFFMIDNGYIDGKQPISAKITVKYFDMGADSWSLKYDASSGEKVAGTITKTGSKQLKTVTFTVNDARFAGRLTGGSDFYLDSRNPADNALDGNEWVHAVEVEKTGTGVEDPTPTPTITPTATPTTGAVEGFAYNDINKNGSRDDGEPGVAGAVMSLSDLVTTDKYTATSGADGKYRFEGVEPGQYTLKEKTAPPGYLKNSTFALVIVVQSNATFSQGTNVGHERDNVLPLNNRTYMPTLLR
jgi:hypothetical protein